VKKLLNDLLVNILTFHRERPNATSYFNTLTHAI
jgi:hypothetical protein